jgi:hypothetical protein
MQISLFKKKLAGINTLSKQSQNNKPAFNASLSISTMNDLIKKPSRAVTK